jgi:hypothetical protein
MSTDISEEHIAFIITVAEYAKQETRMKQIASRDDMFLQNVKLTFNGLHSVISQKTELFKKWYGNWEREDQDWEL